MTAKKRFKRLVRQRAAKTGESYTAALRHFPPKPGGSTMTTIEDRGVFKCSFCGKDRTEVRKLIAGPGVYICDECTQLCVAMIDEEDHPEPGSLPAGAPPEVVLGWLRGVARSVEAVEHDLATKVRFLLSHDVSWQEIAAALGAPEDDVRRRFGDT